MKRYGLQIGDRGVEFSSMEELQKAINTFTKGVCITISEGGIKYRDGKNTFSTYERDDKEVLATCYECKGIFSLEMAPKREYPIKYSYEKTFSTTTNHICEACFTQAKKTKELFDAQQLVAKATKGEDE